MVTDRLKVIVVMNEHLGTRAERRSQSVKKGSGVPNVLGHKRHEHEICRNGLSPGRASYCAVAHKPTNAGIVTQNFGRSFPRDVKVTC